MEALVLTSRTGKEITTSLIVAEVFGKEHKNVLADIKNMSCSDQFRELNFQPSSYISSQGKELPMYEMTKDGFSFLVMGYTGEKAGEFKEKFITAFNQREALLKNDDYIISRAMSLLSERAKALESQVLLKDEQLRLQEHVIKKAAPKIEYYEDVLQSESLIPANVIAKEFGMSARALNKILHQFGIIYKSGDTWVLYKKYQDKGFTDTRTHKFVDRSGITRTEIHTYWTEKGREFIHNLLKKEKAA